MSLKDRIQKALETDNSIVITKADMLKPDFLHAGFGYPYMKYLGLKKSDLKKLERNGQALRSHTKNTWVEGDKMPNGKEVEKGRRYCGKGSQTRWLLFIKD